MYIHRLNTDMYIHRLNTDGSVRSAEQRATASIRLLGTQNLYSNTQGSFLNVQGTFENI